MCEKTGRKERANHRGGGEKRSRNKESIPTKKRGEVVTRWEGVNKQEHVVCGGSG